MTRNEESGQPVTVLESSDPAVLIVAKSLLEGANILHFAKGEAIQELKGLGRLGMGFNPIFGPVQLQVAAADAEEAEALLRELRV